MNHLWWLIIERLFVVDGMKGLGIDIGKVALVSAMKDQGAKQASHRQLSSNRSRVSSARSARGGGPRHRKKKNKGKE